MNLEHDLFGELLTQNKTIKRRVGFIDADILMYRACCVGMKPIVFGSDDDEDVIEVYDFNLVSQIFDESLIKVVEQFNLDQFYLCISHKENFRKKVVPYYKSNRTQEKPIHLDRLKDYANNNYDCIILAGTEADDVCAIKCTQQVKGEYRIAVSVDKDFLTVNMVFANLNTGIEHTTTWLDAFRGLCIQALMGDRVDGYLGLKGFGKVKSAKVVDDYILSSSQKTIVGSTSFVAKVFNGLMETYLKEFSENGSMSYDECEEYFWQQIQCLYLLRDGDYDIENKKVRLITHNNFCEMLKDKTI